MGEVDLVLEIGLAQFQVICQVMDFSSVYNIFLRRPWIHTSGVVPSSLHQMLRFAVNGQLITIFAEEDCTMIVNLVVAPHFFKNNVFRKNGFLFNFEKRNVFE